MTSDSVVNHNHVTDSRQSNAELNVYAHKKMVQNICLPLLEPITKIQTYARKLQLCVPPQSDVTEQETKHPPSADCGALRHQLLKAIIKNPSFLWSSLGIVSSMRFNADQSY